MKTWNQKLEERRQEHFDLIMFIIIGMILSILLAWSLPRAVDFELEKAEQYYTRIK